MAADHLTTAFEFVPERRIASLYDVAMLYAGCGLYEKLTSPHSRSDLPLAVLRAMTPHEKVDLLDPEEDTTFIAVRIDLSGNKPCLGDPSVVIENYTEEIVFQVGHMYRQKTGSQTAYSIVNGASSEPPEKIAHDSWGNRFLRGRLERWPFCDAADTIIEEGHDEENILTSLRTLGSKENVLDDIEQSLVNQATFNKTSALIGIKVKLNSDSKYLYPGEVPVLNKVALRRRENDFLSVSVDDSSGNGTDFVTGEEGTVHGGSTGILSQYGKKQVERFPNLDSEESWRSRPIREEIASEVFNFGSLLRNGLYRMVNGVRIYYLSYPREPMTPDLFKRFYDEVYEPLRSSDDSIAALERVLTSARDSEPYNEDIGSPTLEAALAELDEEGNESPAYEVFEGEDAWLHVYGLMHVAKDTPKRTYVDEPSISLRALAELSDESDRVVEMLGGTSLFGTMMSNMDRLSRGQTPRRILQGRFFDDTTAKSPDEDENRASNFSATADDALFAREAKLLRGKPIAAGSLLEDYVRCIIKKQQSMMGASNNDSFPKWVVVEQYAQLLALEKAELLQPDKVLSHGLANMSAMKLDKNCDSRDDRLQDFLSSHDALKTAEARAVFLTGGLIARVTATQYEKKVSTKMVDQHPVSSVTKRSLQRIVHQAIEKNTTYEQMDDHQSNRRYTDRLPGVMLQSNPQSWNLTETEVKWLYALGTAYGKQDSSLDPDPDTDTAESEPKAKSD